MTKKAKKKQTDRLKKKKTNLVLLKEKRHRNQKTQKVNFKTKDH